MISFGKSDYLGQAALGGGSVTNVISSRLARANSEEKCWVWTEVFKSEAIYIANSLIIRPVHNPPEELENGSFTSKMHQMCSVPAHNAGGIYKRNNLRQAFSSP